MTILGKKQMSEEDIKLNYITPVIQKGWKGHITMETKITDGRINISGNIVVRSKPKFADYMLYLNDGKPIAVVEAKDNSHSVSFGLQQAMTYAQMMDLPFAYSSNGDAFYEHDFLTGQEQQIELDKFPTQDELVARYYTELNGGKAHLGSNVGKIELLNSDSQTFVLEEYVLWYLKSTYGYAELTKYKKATAQESISIDAIRNVVIAIPPLEEQHRIVAKLEEILPLCERLK